MVGGRQGGLETALLERDDADVDFVRLGADERQRCLLRGGKTAGRHVGGGHAARDVHGEDDGAGGTGHRDGRRRAGHGDREHGDAGDGEPDTPEPGAASPGATCREPGRGEGRGPPSRDDYRGPGQARGHEQADGQESGVG